MRTRWAIFGFLALLTWTGTARGQVDLSGLDRDMAGPRTQVLVLGTVHLSRMPEGFEPRSLEPLLARLAAFEPDVITIEAISGMSCDLMARYPTIYDPEGLARHCAATDDARAATGLDGPSAIAEARETLGDWPAHPTPAQRRRLAAVFLAAGDDTSALVQWLHVPDADRRAGDGLNEALAARLDGLVTRRNEDYLIAARLAARLGLDRVVPVDDHTGDNISVDDERAFAAAIQDAWSSADAEARPVREREQALIEAGDMLALYRYVNRPDVLQTMVESDFGAALRDASPQHYGQMYVAGWETRNLRMIANVLAAHRQRPGARVLCIVGSSHKPWFDSVLGQAQGVDVVDAEEVLKPRPK